MNTNTKYMNTKLKIALCSAFIAAGIQMHSQVGIGVSTPNTFSILDLTQTGAGIKGVLLPKGDVSPNSIAGRPEAMIIYYSDQVYLKQSGGFNAMNPWKYKFNGNTAEDIAFSPSSMVGVGIGVNTGAILGNLHVSATSKEVTAAGNTAASAALFIGNLTSTTHMIFDADEIMVKATNTTGGLLKLQEEAGSIQIGSDRIENVQAATIHLNTTIGSATNNKKLTVYGNVNAQSGKVQEKGYDLVPPGTIVAFFGATPKGWAPCDGQKYTLDGTGNAVVNAAGAQTPNLGGQRIVGEGTGYTFNTTGPNVGVTPLGKTRTLATANLPDHTHTGNTQQDGSHSHTSQRANLVDNDDNDDTFCAIGYSCGSDPSGGANNGTIDGTGSSHIHALNPTGQTCASCTATAFNIEAPYVVLRYIMKL